MADMKDLHSSASTLFARGGGLHAPPEVLLAWPKPNYVNPETRGWGGAIFCAIMMGIATVVYIARMWARVVVSKNTGWDDILISISMLPLLGLTITTVLGKHYVLSLSRIWLTA